MESDNYWDSGLKMLSACGQAPESITVFIKPTVKRKIDILMDKYKSREWLAYLIGKDFIIEDMVFPKQVATAGSVNDIEFPSDIKDKIIGVIHSHHTMGSFFSGTDHEYINGNHDISIVVSHQAIAGQVRWTTPCGGKMKVNAKVRIHLPHNFDETSFIADVESKMMSPQPVVRNWDWSNRFQDDETPSLREAMSDM